MDTSNLSEHLSLLKLMVSTKNVTLKLYQNVMDKIEIKKNLLEWNPNITKR